MGCDPSTGKLLCAAGRIPGAVKMAGVWLIPKGATKPIDRRIKSNNSEIAREYKIMIVDDEPDILDLLEKALTIEGFHNILKVDKRK